MMNTEKQIQARFSQSRNDMYWSIFASGETIRWSGYDDAYWWDNVSKSPGATDRTASDGTIYRLNHADNTVEVVPAA